MFCYLNKSEKDMWLPKLFDLLYENMHSIAPSDLSYDQEKYEWLAAVSPALDKEPRQIILCFVQGELAGFLQYYTRQHMLMIEEIQFKRKFHRTSLLYGLCKYLRSVLHDDLQTIEAYADKRNLNSIRLMTKLGMTGVALEDDSPFVHMRGSADRFLAISRKCKGGLCE